MGNITKTFVLCLFSKIHLGSIPKTIEWSYLTDNIRVELPFVPDEFYKQKQIKATRPSKPVTRRNKRTRIQMEKLEENTDYRMASVRHCFK